jgi:putative DNA primase/helicase
VWDATPRIEFVLCDAWGAADTATTRAASINLFVAMLARALRPGAKVDTLWAFEGAQGAFKSMALRELGGELHAEISAAVGTTDFQREMRGLWLAELSELDALRGREASTVKRLLSAREDRFVEKYEKHATTYQRRAVIGHDQRSELLAGRDGCAAAGTDHRWRNQSRADSRPATAVVRRGEAPLRSRCGLVGVPGVNPGASG